MGNTLREEFNELVTERTDAQLGSFHSGIATLFPVLGWHLANTRDRRQGFIYCRIGSESPRHGLRFNKFEQPFKPTFTANT